MDFQARCPECGKRVSAFTMLDGTKLDRVLEKDGEVEVACFQHEHRWN